MFEIDENLRLKILSHIRETMLHKSYVIKSCLKMSDYLVSVGKEDLGVLLLQRANIHDNSKLVGPELELLSSIYGSQNAFLNPNIALTENEKMIIEAHWANNRHHPEHFDDLSKMSELDMLEMVCDWYARSLQYETDFLDFLKTRQETRFNFPEDLFKKIFGYCEILEK